MNNRFSDGISFPRYLLLRALTILVADLSDDLSFFFRLKTIIKLRCVHQISKSNFRYLAAELLGYGSVFPQLFNHLLHFYYL